MTTGDRSALNARQRQAHLAQMGDHELDVLVIGGGVTGCGIALDAATRGLSVGLLEQRDYASGTSSRSSKMFHGGLRYLEQFHFRLVREALAERNLMMNKLCPHLVEPAAFLYPLRHRIWERLYVGAGILVYDVLARMSDSSLPSHRHLTKAKTLQDSPSLDGSKLAGSVKYWDLVVDDARHTMTLARTAALHGALLSPSTRVTDLIEDGGKISGVTAVDLEHGRRIAIRARAVISAGGVWTDDIQRLAGDDSIDVTASKGVHLVVPRSVISSQTGLILRTDLSVLFVVPWGEYWILGTTDTPWTLHRAHPAASAGDVDYILQWINTALTRPLSKTDVIGVYAGLRPLLSGESDATSKLSREHAVKVSRNGLISIAGGKYTTYRVMARDAVDAASEVLGRPVAACVTDRIPLVGKDRTGQLRELVDAEPKLGHSLGESRYTLADVMYATTHEGALHLDDVLTRRTRVSIETKDRGVLVAARVADLMAAELGWDKATIQREIAHYTARVEAERDSQTRLDDETADAARMGAPDVRTGAGD